MTIKTLMETTTCSRCGGSGRYSYNMRDGDRCYGCAGKGVKYTKRANVALDLFRTLREQPFDSFTVGDLVRYRTMNGERTVQLASEPVETKNAMYGKHADGSTNREDKIYLHSVILSWGSPDNRKGEHRVFPLSNPPVFGAVVSEELHSIAVDFMIEYQNLLTQQGTVRKDSIDRAAEVENEIREIFTNPTNRVHKPVVMPIR